MCILPDCKTDLCKAPPKSKLFKTRIQNPICRSQAPSSVWISLAKMARAGDGAWKKHQAYLLLHSLPHLAHYDHVWRHLWGQCQTDAKRNEHQWHYTNNRGVHLHSGLRLVLESRERSWLGRSWEIHFCPLLLPQCSDMRCATRVHHQVRGLV